MGSRTWYAPLLIAVVFPGAVAAGERIFPYGLDVHFTAPSYAMCTDAAVADAALSCETIQPNYVTGYEVNLMWILVDGIPDRVGADGGIGGIQFGIDYPPGVILMSWAVCTGGSEIPQGDERTWPEPFTGNAITWAGGCYEPDGGPDGMTRVGVFVVPQESVGVVRTLCDPRIGIAQGADCATTVRTICSFFFGEGDTTPGGTAGVHGCGTSDLHCDGGPYDPPEDTCYPGVPVRATTWGQLKQLYD